MDQPDREAEPQFSQPVRQVVLMLVALGLAATAAVLFQAGTSAPETRVLLAVDGVPVSEIQVTPGPGRTTVRFPFVLPAVGVAPVSVVDPVGYAADNRRYRLLDPAASALVLLVTSDPLARDAVFYLERALAPA